MKRKLVLFLIVLSITLMGCQEKVILPGDENLSAEKVLNKKTDEFESVVYYKSKPLTGKIHSATEKGLTLKNINLKKGKLHGIFFTASQYSNQVILEYNEYKNGELDGTSKTYMISNRSFSRYKEDVNKIAIGDFKTVKVQPVSESKYKNGTSIKVEG